MIWLARILAFPFVLIGTICFNIANVMLRGDDYFE